MGSPIFISNPPPGFSVVAIVRGCQLAVLGAYRSLQNPGLFRSDYYKQALVAIKYSIFMQLLLWSPVVVLLVLARFVGLFVRLQWLERVAAALTSFQFNVLNISVFLVSASRYFTKDLDNMFLSSLEFIDSVFIAKHPELKDHQYYSNLVALGTTREQPASYFTPVNFEGLKTKYANSTDFASFIKRHATRTLLNVGIFLMGKLPVVGSVLLGLISFQNLNSKIGTVRAMAIFGVFQLIPKYYSVLFLSTFWGARSMVHDLLLPYFTRVRFTNREKDQWIKSREGLLFGFGLCFYLLIRKLPWVGLLLFGFAETSAAYLITKVSDPPPSQSSKLIEWNTSQLMWNKEKETTVLKGGFANTDDGFEPIPGSFIFSKHD